MRLSAVAEKIDYDQKRKRADLGIFTTPLGRSTSGVRLFLSIGVDITDRKHAERERERLLEREQTLRSEAENANRLKDEFFSKRIA